MLEALIIPKNNDVQRLFHGRGKAYSGFEHVTIDWLAPILLVSLFREVDSSLVNLIGNDLRERIPQAQSIVFQHRDRPGTPYDVWWGEPLPDSLMIYESGLGYEASFSQQNLGLFLDMANGRDWVRQNAAGRNVLNLFAYTCAFSVVAREGGARQVVNVDMSKRALSIGRNNHRHNNQDLDGIYFEGLDIFRSYGRMKKRGPYNLLICDPPTFQKGSVDIRKDYPKLMRRLPELLAPEADLLLCLNAPELGVDFLLRWMEELRPDCRFVQRIPNPSVFVETEENAGLKALLFRYQAS